MYSNQLYYQFSFMLAILLIVIAGVTVLIMLEMNSTPQENSEKNNRAVQRFLGYLFLVLFAGMLAYMVFRTGSFQGDMPAPVMILALLLVPLIMIKVVVARQKALISTKLILLGTAIFGLSFGLTAMAAYYYNKQHSGEKTIYTPEVSMESGHVIMSKKCSKCHTLDRIYAATVAEWTPTVSKMAAFDSSDISNAEAGVIAAYLNEKRLHDELQQKKKLILVKCTTMCHKLDKISAAKKNEQRWRETIERMITLTGDPKYLSDEEKNTIAKFLANNMENLLNSGIESTLSPPIVTGVRSLVARKCSAGCHKLDQVLIAKKTKEVWTETINNMIEITGNPGYLSEQEKQQIIEFLSLPIEERDKQGHETYTPPKSSHTDHPLINSKCGRCHDTERLHQANKNQEEWEKTVSIMAEGTGDPHYLSEQEKKDIVTIISSWEVIK
ncbi:photosystem P840 reaction-center cytochrome c-551 [Desulfobulbus sp. F5]|nr:photosystem P840 reaction-center cytochrome c-551 [Desulfobulbus sp. F5]